MSIHPDLDHPAKIMDQHVLVSILTKQGPESKMIRFHQIDWGSVDQDKDTVLILSKDTEASVPETAVFSTMEFIRKESKHLELDKSKYAESVGALMRLALGDTGGSKVAAQVLLSAYNGRYFQLNVASLCNLDDDYYRHAMNVIHGRKSTYTEPQNQLENGDDVFNKLWDQWEYLHINERFKTFCEDCSGGGKRLDKAYEPTTEDCRACSGTGRQLPQGLEYSAW